MGVHACNPSTQEAETGELQVPGQPGLRSETLTQKKKKKNSKKYSKFPSVLKLKKV
jgi:hypothetical protein